MSGLIQFAEEARMLLSAYTDLILGSENGVPFLAGNITLETDDGADSYQVKIVGTDNYPNRFPFVFETGGKIPRNIDWHIFESDGHCCIKAIPEELIICKDGLTLLNFIEKQLKPYLYNQTFRKKHGYFLNERSHGIKGTIEYFEELFQTSDVVGIVSFLTYILKNKEPRRTAECFCGKKLKFRKCHKKSFRIIKKLENYEICYFIEEIKKSRSYQMGRLDIPHHPSF